MAQVITDRRDIDFVLYEQFNVEELTQHKKFAEFNKKTFDLIINEARNLAVKEILPTFAEGDREGVRLENGQVKEYNQGLIDLLTPIIKSYCSDRGFEICAEAIQVHGGYGYTRDYPVEQLLRDCKIASIYEGTNGIQAMDLLGRKLGMKGGVMFMDFLQEIQKITGQAQKIKELEDLAADVDQAVNRLGEVAMHLGKTALSPEIKVAFAYAKPFLDVMGDVCLAWMLLWRATIAVPKLEKLAGGLDPKVRHKTATKNKDAAFYEGQLQSARYFINSILPITMGKMNAIEAADPAVVEIPEASFGG